MPIVETFFETLIGTGRTPAVEIAAAWLATYWLHSGLLLGGAWLAGRWLGHRRLAVQETLWRVALVGGLVTASLQLGLGFRPLAGGWSLPAPADGAAAVEAPAVPGPAPTVATASRPARVARLAGAESAAPAAIAAGVALPTLVPPTSMPWLAADPSDPDGLPPVPAAAARSPLPAPPAWAVPAAVALWLAGALLLILRLALAHGSLGRRLRARTPIHGGPLASLVARLRAAAGVHRRVGLSRTAAIPVPIARGLVRGEICLPERALAELSAGEQEGMVAHELAHVVRRDPAWLLAARALECAFFVQPLHALARRRLREIAEYRCDDWAAEATGRPLSLARCLTEVAGWSLGRAAVLPAPSMAAGRSALGRRVRRLLERPAGDERKPRWLPLAAAGALATVAAVAPGVWGPATAAGQEPDDQAAAIERAIEEEYAREQGQQTDADQTDADQADTDYDADADADYDGDQYSGGDEYGSDDYDGDQYSDGEEYGSDDYDGDQYSDGEEYGSDDYDGDQYSDGEEYGSDDYDGDQYSDGEEYGSDDYDGDQYSDGGDTSDAEEWRSEAEQRADDAEEAVMEAFEREMESFEREMEAAFEPLDEQFESDMEALDESLEQEMEGFEEQFERDFEHDFEAMAEQFEALAEEMAESAGAGGMDQEEVAAMMADLGNRIGTEAAALAESFSGVAAETGALMQERFGEDFARQIEALAAAATPDPELMARLEPELERLQAEARRLAEEDRFAGADAERLRDEARALAEQMQPSREELDRIRDSARRLAEELAPTREELQRLHEEQRRAVEQWRTEHRDELERLRDDLAQERDRMRVELERIREQHGQELEQRQLDLQRQREELEVQREELRREREELRREQEERRRELEERDQGQ